MVTSKISVINMQARENIRKYYKEIRKNMPSEAVRQNSAQICERILASEWYKNAKVLLGYYPLGNEVNILPVLEHALTVGKIVALPRTDKDSRMDFYIINNLDADVVEGAFHIFEPKNTCELITPAVSDDGNRALVLVPGVVFDNAGNRYGYGRGFYDRYFARFEKVCRVGIAYDLQITSEKLEVYPTDVIMHSIVTENKEIEVKVREWNY